MNSADDAFRDLVSSVLKQDKSGYAIALFVLAKHSNERKPMPSASLQDVPCRHDVAAEDHLGHPATGAWEENKS